MMNQASTSRTAVRMNSSLLFASCTLALAFSAPAQSPSPQLKSVLDQMDLASARFKSAQADVQYDNYTKVVRDHTLQSGSMFVERTGGVQQMGAAFYDLGPGGKPGKTPAKVLVYDGSTLQIYSPGINQNDIFQAGANQAKYESFLTLGFGGSGRDLQKNWTVEDNGPETLNDGATPVKVEKLDLVSKDANVRNLFERVTIWVDPARGLSLKQIFYAPHGDTRTATYSNVRLNGKIDRKPYTISKSATPIRH